MAVAVLIRVALLAMAVLAVAVMEQMLHPLLSVHPELSILAVEVEVVALLAMAATAALVS